MTDRGYVAEIMEARGDLSLPTPLHSAKFTVTEACGELPDAELRLEPEYERNNAKAHTPEEELSDTWHMLHTTIGLMQAVIDSGGTLTMDKQAQNQATLMSCILQIYIDIADGAMPQSALYSARTSVNELAWYSETYYNLTADDLHAAAIAKLQRRKPAPDFVTCGCGRYNSVMHCNGEWMCMECYREAMKKGAA